MRPRLPPVALVAFALIVGSGLYAVLDLFFPPALSLAFVCLPILPWLRPGFLRPLRSAEDARESVEVLPHLFITLQTGAMSAALALAVLAGGLSTHAQRRAGGSDCRLHMTDGVEGPVRGWFEGGSGTGARPFRLVHGLNCEGSVRAFQRGSDHGPPRRLQCVRWGSGSGRRIPPLQGPPRRERFCSRMCASTRVPPVSGWREAERASEDGSNPACGSCGARRGPWQAS